MTTLYDYWRSSASYRVRIALNLLGIGYDSVPVDLLAGMQRGAMLTEAGTYCHGDQVTMADTCLIPQVYNAGRVGLDLTVHPRLSAIAARLAALPEIAAAHPGRVRPAK